MPTRSDAPVATGADGRSIHLGADAFMTASCDIVEALTHIHLLSSTDTIAPAMDGQSVISATVKGLSVPEFTVTLVAVMRRRRAAANGKLLR